MRIRKRSLPPGWYPGSKSSITAFIKEHLGSGSREEASFMAGIVPHAGWTFSGGTAARVMTGLLRDVETIVVVGGHLPPGSTILAAEEEAFEIPQGILENDTELLETVRELCTREAIDIMEDIHTDNTVEVQLPMIHYFFPSVKVIGMRAAPSRVAERLGRIVKEAADNLGRKVALIGSTDLTHYGSNYGFSPEGHGARAIKWVTEVNDKRFVDASLEMDVPALLKLAIEERSACSAGGAAAAVGFAKAIGIGHGALVEYMTSYDVHPSESFVGYAGIGF